MTNAVQIPAQKNHRQRLGARRAQIQPPRHRSAAGASRTVLLDCGVPGFTPSRANRCSSSWILKVIRRCLQGFGSWGEVFGDRVIATAILDRILHHAITVNIRGNSYRLKEKLKAGLVRPAEATE